MRASCSLRASWQAELADTQAEAKMKEPRMKETSTTVTAAMRATCTAADLGLWYACNNNTPQSSSKTSSIVFKIKNKIFKKLWYKKLLQKHGSVKRSFKTLWKKKTLERVFFSLINIGQWCLSVWCLVGLCTKWREGERQIATIHPVNYIAAAMDQPWTRCSRPKRSVAKWRGEARRHGKMPRRILPLP